MEVSISVKLAAFHFQKHVSRGVPGDDLRARRHPAVVGHPAKRYRPSKLSNCEASIPSRLLDLDADILAETLNDSRLVHPSETCSMKSLSSTAAGSVLAPLEHNGVSRLITALRIVSY